MLLVAVSMWQHASQIENKIDQYGGKCQKDQKKRHSCPPRMGALAIFKSASMLVADHGPKGGRMDI